MTEPQGLVADVRISNPAMNKKRASRVVVGAAIAINLIKPSWPSMAQKPKFG
jgi:hypothetical protein